MEKTFVCPMPDPWNLVYQTLLVAWQADPKGKNGPPIPLILGGWNFSGDYDKKYRWEATIRWAEEIGLKDLIPVFTPEQVYSVYEMQHYDDDYKLDWNYDPRRKPDSMEVQTTLEILRANWVSIAGPELGQRTSPIRFTGEKSRRLLVNADPNWNPPWGTWMEIFPGRHGKEFTQLRSSVNKAISPMEVDHIDFDIAEWKKGHREN